MKIATSNFEEFPEIFVRGLQVAAIEVLRDRGMDPGWGV